jgi:hypothetical protein
MNLDNDTTFLAVLTVGTLLASMAGAVLAVLAAGWVERRKGRASR